MSASNFCLPRRLYNLQSGDLGYKLMNSKVATQLGSQEIPIRSTYSRLMQTLCMFIFILNKHILWEPPYYLPGWAKHIALWPWWQLPHGYSQVTAGWQPPVSWPLWSCGRTAPGRKTDGGNKFMWKLFHHIYTHIFSKGRKVTASHLLTTPLTQWTHGIITGIWLCCQSEW